MTTTTIGLGTLAVCARHILSDEKSSPYAKTYARALIQLIWDEWPLCDIRTQVLYVRGNLAHWRGDTAKAVRRDLDTFLAETRNVS